MKKSNLQILIPIIGTCNNCAPRRLDKNNKKRYRDMGERCKCLLELDSHTVFSMNFRKIEVYLALREMNHNSFPASYYHGLGVNIEYEIHLFKAAMMLNPFSIHPYFQKDKKPCLDMYVRQIMDLKIHLQQFRVLLSPKPPSYDSIVFGSKYERRLGSRMSLLSCVMDSWFFYGNKKPFFLAYEDFIINKENKGWIKRRRFSKTLNTMEQITLFVAFIERTPIFKEVENFCIPEDGELFKRFLQSNYYQVKRTCSIH